MPNFVFPVAEYMTAPVIIAHVGDDLNLAQKLLSEHRVSALAVVDAKHQLAGVISRTDLLKIGRIQAGAAMKASLLTLPHRSVEDVMTKDVVTVQTTDSLEKATQLMVEKRLHRIFITQENHPIGVLSTKDIMRAVAEKRINAPLTEFMSSPVFTVRANEPISLATERLERAKVSGLVVVEDKWPVGIFTQREALMSKDLPRDTPTEEVMSLAMLSLEGGTRLFRAAQQACAMGVRRTIVVEGHQLKGILTGLDFARVTI